jgi:hypothetical protein
LIANRASINRSIQRARLLQQNHQQLQQHHNHHHRMEERNFRKLLGEIFSSRLIAHKDIHDNNETSFTRNSGRNLVALLTGNNDGRIVPTSIPSEDIDDELVCPFDGRHSIPDLPLREIITVQDDDMNELYATSSPLSSYQHSTLPFSYNNNHNNSSNNNNNNNNRYEYDNDENDYEEKEDDHHDRQQQHDLLEVVDI